MQLNNSAIIAEYSKSSIHRCKCCGRDIARNVIRIGYIINNANRKLNTQKWYHVNCLRAPPQQLSHIDIKDVLGMNELTKSDREYVLDYLQKVLFSNEQNPRLPKLKTDQQEKKQKIESTEQKPDDIKSFQDIFDQLMDQINVCEQVQQKNKKFLKKNQKQIEQFSTEIQQKIEKSSIINMDDLKFIDLEDYE